MAAVGVIKIILPPTQLYLLMRTDVSISDHMIAAIGNQRIDDFAVIGTVAKPQALHGPEFATSAD